MIISILQILRMGGWGSWGKPACIRTRSGGHFCSPLDSAELYNRSDSPTPYFGEKDSNQPPEVKGQGCFRSEKLLESVTVQSLWGNWRGKRNLRVCSGPMEGLMWSKGDMLLTSVINKCVCSRGKISTSKILLISQLKVQSDSNNGSGLTALERVSSLEVFSFKASLLYQQ